MNNTYRLIWNEVANTWVAVAENAKSRGKRSAGALLLTAVASVAMAQTVSTQQLPTGGQIVSGSGAISAQGKAMTVNQNTDRMITNWSSFNIGANASVNFVQPSASAVALNRIQSQDPTQIMGRLSANGHVMLVNPAGVVFGRGSQVDVGSLVASTLAISDANFMNGNYRFAAGGLNVLGAVVNQGRITTANGGAVAFLAPVVKNDGQINTTKGSTLLGAAQDITVDFAGDGLIRYRVNAGAASALIENTGTVRADGGMAVLSAQSVDNITQGVVNNSGVVRAQRLENRDGRIVLEGHALLQTGSVVAPVIGAKVNNLITSGNWDASASSNATQQGGRVSIEAAGRMEQTDSGRINADGAAGQGGAVRLSASQSVWVSGQISANGAQGGGVTVESSNIVLAGAKVSATGETGDGGSIRIGGGYQGKDTDIVNAQTTRVVASELDVSVSQRGSAGQAIVWSESETVFGSTVKATGGAQSGNGGLVEVSSHDRLTFGGLVDATARAGSNGRLLLDPKNIEIVAAVSAVQVLPLLDPTPTASEYGTGSTPLASMAVEILNAGVSTDRIAIASPMDSNLATNAGAVRLYNSQTGALISTLTGSSQYDYVGTGLVQLNNGNLVVRSQAWGGATALTTTPGNVTQGRGAVTFMNGSTGLTGAVSSSNSLVGSTSGDRVGHGGVNGIGVAVLTNGNYLVSTPTWSNSGLANAGAVTWGSGTAGVAGTISSTNSLVGTSAHDRVGSGLDSSTTSSNTSQAVSKGITVLPNGNYVVTSPYWSGGGTASVGKGAVTWGDGSAGTTGAVSSTNSLVGTRTTDLVGLRGVVALSNSNYVVVSSDWGNGSLLKQGAVTWGNGAGGTVGEVSTANSLIGEKAYTFLGGISYGSAADYLFNPITELAGGQYFVLSSPYWNTNAGTSATSTGNMGKGAVTRLPTASASVKDTFGFIGATNSLVGTTAADHIGRGFDDKTGVVALTGNHTFVVASPYWNNGVASNNVGAVTWVGPSGLVGPVSTSNSLHGTSAQDRVGSTKVSALPNGHYVVSSRLWTGGAGSTANLGAVTWGDGTSGITGPVDANNSLVGSTSGDQVGDQIVVLNNGNYVVGSPFWNNGAVADVGAVTLGIGSTAGPRTVGAVSASNSLVGTTTNDRVGTTIFALPQSSTTSNYVVLSSSWDRDYAIDTGSGTGLEGVVANAGAATWGSGTTGVTGPVSISNSLIGSTASDAVGNTSASFSYFKALSNGNYVLVTPNWNRGALADVGAVTWGSGTSGVTGEISSSNSLLGTLASDKIGSYGVETLRLGNYIVLSPEKNVASTTYNGGAITWGPGSTALTGDIGVYNSFLGGGTVSYTDQLGTGGVLALSDGRALVLSHFGRMGGVSNAGRMDIISYAIPPTLSDAGVFANSASSSQQVAALDIKASMDAGTPVTLQASNDITVSSAITGTNTAGHLTLQAGRSILVNANITTGGANLTLKANEPLSAGVVDAQRDAGAAVVTMASGTTINAGSGNLTVSLGTGAGLTNSTSGDITLRTITAANVSVTNAGTTSGSSITTNNNITAATSVSLEARSGSVTVASGSSNLLAGAGAVSIRARDDITINAALTSPAGSTGGLSMLAGRSVLINQAIQTQNGPITIKANHSDSTDAVSDSRLPGTAVITTAATPTTVTLSAGTGAVDIRIMNGAGLTTTDASAITSGAITLPPNQVTGGDVTVINDGPTLGTSNIASTSNITAKGNVLIKANTGSISIAGISTDGSVTSGAAVSLLAMDDITNTTRAIDNSSANGAVTLKAGRSINLTQNIVAPGGVTVSANTPYDASSGVSASRTAGAASLSVTSSIRATALSNMSVNNGNVSIELANGAGLADSTTGSLAVGAVFGRNINITHNGTSGTGITLSGSLAAYGLYNGSNVRQSVGATNITANNGSILVSANATYQGSGGNTFTMRARDDITLNSVLIDRQLTNGSDPDLGGLVQILAGRSVLFNSEFRTSGSPLTIKANHYDNTSTVSATRLPGAAVITMGGTLGSIRTTGTAAPHGSVTIELMNGTGLSTTDSSAIASGNITLQSIPNANNLTVTNNGPTPGSGIVVAASGLGIGATGGTTGPTRIGPITGLINLSTRNGDINLQGNIATSSTASGAITLVAGTAASAPTSTGGDVILTGTRTLTTGAGGSTFLFSGSAANSTGVTALATSARTFYNVDPANMPGSGITSDVHAFYRQNTLPLTLTLDNTSMVYGDSFPTLPSFTLTGGTFNTGDSITSMAWGSAATAFMAQGTYPYSTSNLITPTFACAAAGCAANYSLTFVNGLTISPRPITITADAKSMTYGGTAPALTHQITAGTLVNNDAFTGALSRAAGIRAGTYAINQNNLSYGSNYAVTYVPANFTINPAVLTISMTNTGVTKPYDGSNAAPAGFTPILSVSGLIANDSAAALSDTGSTYNDAHVAAANKVTVSGLAISGITGSNGSLPSDYVLSANSTFVPATITPVPVTVSSASIGGTLTKAYDGTTAATGATVSGAVSGGIAGDTLNLSASGMTLAYSSPRAGTRTISASGTPSLVITNSSSGSLPSDYSYTAPVIADVSGTITPKALSATASIGGTLSKVYDGSAAAPGALVSGAVSGAVAGDAISVNTGAISVSYNSARVVGANSLRASGTPAVVIDSSTSGSVLSDYSFTAPVIADAAGTITPKSLSATASIGGTLSKVYDGSAAAPGALVSGAVSGAVAGDAISMNTGAISVTYNSARVVGANSLRASGTSTVVIDSSTSGSVLSDYSFTAPVIADVSGTITPKLLVSSLTNTNVSKPFDGTVSTPSGFEPQFSVSGLIGGDTFASLSGTASFNTADPQTANAVVVSSLAISRIDGSNGSVPTDYRLDSSEKFVSAKIIQQPLFLPALIQTSTTATTVTSSQNIESRKENVLIAERVAVSAVSTAPAPQFKLAAVLNFGDADVGMDLLVTPNSSSLTLAQSTTSEGSSKENAEVKTNTIDLFTQTGTTVAAGGALSIVEQGRSLSASNLSTSSSAPSDINLTGMRFVNVDYSVPSGGKNQISVGVSSDGVLVVKVPSAMKAASDDRSLALIGMATAKARLDVQPANVKGVVIQVE